MYQSSFLFLFSKKAALVRTTGRNGPNGGVVRRFHTSLYFHPTALTRPETPIQGEPNEEGQGGDRVDQRKTTAASSRSTDCAKAHSMRAHIQTGPAKDTQCVRRWLKDGPSSSPRRCTHTHLDWRKQPAAETQGRRPKERTTAARPGRPRQKPKNRTDAHARSHAFDARDDDV